MFGSDPLSVFTCPYLKDSADAGTGRYKVRYQYGKPHFDETDARYFPSKNDVPLIDEDQDDPDEQSVLASPPDYFRIAGTSQPELHDALTFTT